MKILFCADPFDTRQPDPAFESEVRAAEALKLDYFLIQFESLLNEGNGAQSIRAVPRQASITPAIYRGWMMKPEQYMKLYAALEERHIRLINTPSEYSHCHYLPESYPIIEQYTPKTVWTTDTSIDTIMSLLQTFGDKPVILKDFVKSQKHYWYEACYIPSASNRVEVERVVKRFLELQGDDLNEGLVFREFVYFEALIEHSKSAMPLSKEYRIFWFNGEPIYTSEYWNEGDYHGLYAPFDQFRDVAKAVNSHFFTMDIAKQQDGDWLIVELGDGQVAGLPEGSDSGTFYRSLVG